MGQNIFPVHLVVEQVETVARLALRLLVQLSLKHPDLYWCFQAHRQSPLLSFFQSASEVRVLPSAGITRHRRYRDPLRLPSLAVILTTTLEAQPPPFPDLPQLPRPPSLHAVLNTPVDRTGACRFLPCSRGLPRLTGGSASTTSLSGPAQASLALQPARSQPAQGGLLSRGFDPAGYPTEPLGSYHVLPTTTWMDPPSTGDLRRWGAPLNNGERQFEQEMAGSPAKHSSNRLRRADSWVKVG
jgi:hypothetical protein